MQDQQTASVTVTVDIVIPRLTSTTLEVLLIKRRKKPYQNMWALPGGKLNADDPSLEVAILRETREETGIDIPAHLLQQVHTFGDAGRDPRGCYVSVLYTLTEPLSADIQARAGDDACEARWFPALIERPQLAFDHEYLLDWAVRFLFEWRRTNHPGLERLETPAQCAIGCECGERCPLPASWSVNGWAVCDEDIRFMADMNGDNEEMLRLALQAMSGVNGSSEEKPRPALASLLFVLSQQHCLQQQVPVTFVENDIQTASLWMGLSGGIYALIEDIPYTVNLVDGQWQVKRDENGNPVYQGVERKRG